MTLSTTSACVGGRHAPARFPSIEQLVGTAPQYTRLDLTPKEAEAIEHYILTGTCEGAGARMGVCLKTIEAHFTNARRKNGIYKTIQLAVRYSLEKHGIYQEQQ